MKFTANAWKHLPAQEHEIIEESRAARREAFSRMTLDRTCASWYDV